VSNEKDQKVTLVNGGYPSRIPYTRFEIPKISKVNDTYAITLYQIDYVNFAERAATGQEIGTLDAEKGEVIPVARLATSRAGLMNLKMAIEELLNKTVG
jgi:hypothetical protein